MTKYVMGLGNCCHERVGCSQSWGRKSSVIELYDGDEDYIIEKRE